MYFIGFPITSLIFMLLIIIVYFSKKRINLIENKLLITAMIINVVGLILEISCYWAVNNLQIFTTLKYILLKSYITYIFIFNFFLNLYILVITNKKYGTFDFNGTKFLKKSSLFSCLPFIVGIYLTYKLPMYVYNKNHFYYTYGESIQYLFIVSIILLFFWFLKIFLTLKNKNKWNKQTFAILISIIIIGTIGSLTQFIDKRILILTSIHSFVLLIMYFTIENPDVKMLEEINKNRSIIEKNNEEKSNLLFKISQDVRQPIKEIENKSRNILHKEDIKQIKLYATDINYESLHISKMINSVLDISQMDITNIKIYNSTYNIYNLFNEIILIMNNKFNIDLEFKYSITNNIPDSLYGDSLKLKQIISSILLNSIKYTKKGFVDIDINCIVRYDLCRLIITISDSGKGISIDKINNILETKEELNKEELDKIEDLDVDLKITKKIIDMLGGTLLIKSDLNNGSKFTVILDQRISEKSNLNNQVITNKRRVLLIDDNYQELQHIKYILKRNNLDVTTSMFGKDCIDRIRNKEKYDLIIIDDEMQPDNAIETKQELDKLKTKTKIIIMISSIKEQIKSHYTSDYKFNDIILKSNLDKEVNRVIKKYL